MIRADQIKLACLLEATARKPGNVHPAAAFSDLTYNDFVMAANAIAQPLADVGATGLGQAIFNAVSASHQETRTNVNLGIALLIAPLAAVSQSVPLKVGVPDVLNQTTVEDSEHVYAAIRVAKPGGLGKASSQDVNDRPTVTLRDAMALATDRDRIAEQYATNFAFLFDFAQPWLVEAWQLAINQQTIHPENNLTSQRPGMVPWEAAIIRLQLKILAHAPDSLVARKCGPDTALELQKKADEVLQTGWPDHPNSWPLFHNFDDWLRADGHRRNPGTTADLVAATLFIGLRDGLITAPTRDEILNHADTIRRASPLRLS